jgi:IstB-like ATP binding protein
MKTTDPVDAARLELMLTELRLPAIKLLWSRFADQADKEGWPAARFLAALSEHEIAERDRRRIERHLVDAKLLVGKTLETFDFDTVPMVSKAQVMALAAGDSWLEKGANLICSGRPVPGRVIWRRLSASLLSKTAGASCSPGPPTSSRSFRSRAAIWRSRRRSTSSTSTIS